MICLSDFSNLTWNMTLEKEKQTVNKWIAHIVNLKQIEGVDN